MQISTENAAFSTSDPDLIENTVRSSREIWISGESKYPCLTILTSGEKACVNYFGRQESDMWLSQSESTQSEVFIAGGEQWQSPADAVISIDEALQCVREFCGTLTRPACIKWQYGV